MPRPSTPANVQTPGGSPGPRYKTRKYTAEAERLKELESNEQQAAVSPAPLATPTPAPKKKTAASKKSSADAKKPEASKGTAKKTGPTKTPAKGKTPKKSATLPEEEEDSQDQLPKPSPKPKSTRKATPAKARAKKAKQLPPVLEDKEPELLSTIEESEADDTPSKKMTSKRKLADADDSVGGERNGDKEGEEPAEPEQPATKRTKVSQSAAEASDPIAGIAEAVVDALQERSSKEVSKKTKEVELPKKDQTVDDKEEQTDTLVPDSAADDLEPTQIVEVTKLDEAAEAPSALQIQEKVEQQTTEKVEVLTTVETTQLEAETSQPEVQTGELAIETTRLEVETTQLEVETTQHQVVATQLEAETGELEIAEQIQMEFAAWKMRQISQNGVEGQLEEELSVSSKRTSVANKQRVADPLDTTYRPPKEGEETSSDDELEPEASEDEEKEGTPSRKRTAKKVVDPSYRPPKDVEEDSSDDEVKRVRKKLGATKPVVHQNELDKQTRHEAVMESQHIPTFTAPDPSGSVNEPHTPSKTPDMSMSIDSFDFVAREEGSNEKVAKQGGEKASEKAADPSYKPPKEDQVDNLEDNLGLEVSNEKDKNATPNRKQLGKKPLDPSYKPPKEGEESSSGDDLEPEASEDEAKQGSSKRKRAGLNILDPSYRPPKEGAEDDSDVSSDGESRARKKRKRSAKGRVAPSASEPRPVDSRPSPAPVKPTATTVSALPSASPAEHVKERKKTPSKTSKTSRLKASKHFSGQTMEFSSDWPVNPSSLAEYAAELEAHPVPQWQAGVPNNLPAPPTPVIPHSNAGVNNGSSNAAVSNGGLWTEHEHRQVPEPPDLDWPALPGSIYCERCFRDLCARSLRIREEVMEVLRLLGGTNAFCSLQDALIREYKASTAVSGPAGQEPEEAGVADLSLPPQRNGDNTRGTIGLNNNGWDQLRFGTHFSRLQRPSRDNGRFQDLPADIRGFLILKRMVSLTYPLGEKGLEEGQPEFLKFRATEIAISSLQRELGLSCRKVERLEHRYRASLLQFPEKTLGVDNLAAEQVRRAIAARKTAEKKLGLDMNDHHLLKQMGNKIRLRDYIPHSLPGPSGGRGDDGILPDDSASVAQGNSSRKRSARQLDDDDNDASGATGNPSKKLKPSPVPDNDGVSWNTLRLTGLPSSVPGSSSASSNELKFRRKRDIALPCTYCSESGLVNQRMARRPHPRSQDREKSWLNAVNWAFEYDEKSMGEGFSVEELTVHDFFELVGKDGELPDEMAGFQFTIDATRPGQTRLVLHRMANVFDEILDAGLSAD